jgi:hypothetical protein
MVHARRLSARNQSVLPIATRSNSETHRQIDGRTAEPDTLAQIARQDFAIARELDRRDVGVDRAQTVGGRGSDQVPRLRGTAGDDRLVG